MIDLSIVSSLAVFQASSEANCKRIVARQSFELNGAFALPHPAFPVPCNGSPFCPLVPVSLRVSREYKGLELFFSPCCSRARYTREVRKLKTSTGATQVRCRPSERSSYLHKPGLYHTF